MNAQKVLEKKFTYEELLRRTPDLFAPAISSATKYADARALGTLEDDDMEQECALLCLHIIDLANKGVEPESLIKDYGELKGYCITSINRKLLSLRHDEYEKSDRKMMQGYSDINDDKVAEVASDCGMSSMETVEDIDNRLYNEQRLAQLLEKIKNVQEEGVQEIIEKVLKLYEDIPDELLIPMTGKNPGNRTRIRFTIPEVAQHLKVSLPELTKAYEVMVNLYVDVMDANGEGDLVQLAVNRGYNGEPIIVDKLYFSHEYKCAECGDTVYVRPANAHEVKYCKPCKKANT